jgi:predicted alpha/beta superfamily hydrolase
MKRVLIAAALLGLGACQTSGPATDVGAAGDAIVLGRGYTIQSAALGEARRINVYLPPGYGAGTQAYPVLYLIDGGVEQDFVHIAGLSQHATISASFREMIVVGIETVDRRRELTAPATRDASLRVDYPTHGEGAKFRAFVADEVKPWVETRYRTDGHDAVMGESLAGLFVVETFLRQPDLFDGYVAVDPSLWWDNGALATETRTLLAAQATGERTVYMAVANGVPAMRLGQTVVSQAIKAAALPGVNFTYAIMDDEEHSTIYHRAALDALRVVFANPAEAK